MSENLLQKTEIARLRQPNMRGDRLVLPGEYCRDKMLPMEKVEQVLFALAGIGLSVSIFILVVFGL